MSYSFADVYQIPKHCGINGYLIVHGCWWGPLLLTHTSPATCLYVVPHLCLKCFAIHAISYLVSLGKCMWCTVTAVRERVCGNCKQLSMANERVYRWEKDV